MSGDETIAFFISTVGLLLLILVFFVPLLVEKSFFKRRTDQKVPNLSNLQT